MQPTTNLYGYLLPWTTETLFNISRDRFHLEMPFLGFNYFKGSKVHGSITTHFRWFHTHNMGPKNDTYQLRPLYTVFGFNTHSLEYFKRSISFGDALLGI